MGIRNFLLARSVRFEVLLHAPSQSSAHLAGSVHVPGRSVAKAVLVKAGEVFALAVLPSTHRVDTGRLAEVLGVSTVRIATECEVEEVFDDCEPGALPPFGRLYGLQTVVDASLSGSSEVVFVANTGTKGSGCGSRITRRSRRRSRPGSPRRSTPGVRRVAGRRADRRAGPVQPRSADATSAGSAISSGAKPRRRVFSVIARVSKNSSR